MSNLSYNIGPKLGDFINGLMVPKYIYDMCGETADIYMSDMGCTYTFPIEQTYEELFEVVSKQPFVNSFSLHKGEKCDYDIYKFRQSPVIFKEDWFNVYFRMFFDKPAPDPYKWMEMDAPSNSLILINRSVRPMSPHTYMWYDKFLSINRDRDIRFICTDPIQYELFPLKDKMGVILSPSIYHTFLLIAGCSTFVGNQSSPLAIASSLGVHRVAELRQSPDAPHYEKEKGLETFVGD